MSRSEKKQYSECMGVVGCPTIRGADSAYRRSLYRGFLALLVYLFRKLVVQTRRCGSWKRGYGSRTEGHGESHGIATGP